MGKVCCKNCFIEPEIKKFIEVEGRKGNCDYCGGEDVFIHDVKYVGSFILEGVYRFYEDAALQVGYSASERGYELPTKDIGQILIQEEAVFGEVDDPQILIDEMGLDCIPYVRIHPYGPPSEDSDEIRYWDSFCKIVKTERRFTTFLSIGESSFFDLRKPDKFLHRFAKNDIPALIKVLTPPTKIFRARIQKKKKTYSHLEITAPSHEDSKNNRMSPTGISFFYGGMDSETCIHEIRPDVSEKIVVGVFEAVRNLFVLDLSLKDEPRKSIFNPEYSFWYEVYTKPFLSHFVSEVSKPLRKYDNKIEYVPTQVFTEFIKSINFKEKYFYPDENGNSGDVYLNGIIFKSSVKKNGKNIVLFRGPDISTDDPKDKGDHWLFYKGQRIHEVKGVLVDSVPSRSRRKNFHRR